MNNYQLYRTNLLLGGQMKWDLILNSTQTSLYVSDFHLSPISNNIPYIYKIDEYLINNTHQDNIKAYYNANKGNFYNEGLNTGFLHNWPIICKENEVINSYSNIYDMGCKRSIRYNIHNKQFEFFCPLWLEHVTDDIVFKIEIKNINTNSIIGSNSLILSVDNINNEYHKQFIKYFNNYITEAGIKDGTDDILNIVFNKNEATVTGLHVSTGIIKTVTINSIIENIVSRERPLMEVDNMLINSLVDNGLICKQLFNFNLCFNIEDIFSKNIVKMMYGENVIVSVDVYMGDTKLEKKDFYTEYDYIEKYVNSDDINFQSENVLSYLKDNEYIEFIDKNKFCQSICHWSLFDNNDYIFNVYDGFGGLFIRKKNNENIYYINNHQYENAPNTYIANYDLSQNTTGWLNIKNINEWSEFYKYVKYTNKYKKDGIYIGNKNTNYINNVKYNTIPTLNNDGIYLLGINTNIEVLINIENNFGLLRLLKLTNNDNALYLLKPNIEENLFLLITSDINLLTYKNFNNIINSFDKTNINTYTEVINMINTLLNSKIDPTLIMLNTSLLYNIAAGPSNALTEIDYIKDNKSYNYVLRYDGKIKPTFKDTTSTLYYKDYISNADINSKLKNSVYSKYNYLNYEPIYPSLNYCAIKKLKNWNYNDCPTVKVSEHDNVNIYNNIYEYSWFNNSKVLILNPEINISVNTINSTQIEPIDIIITAELNNYYKFKDNNLLDYVKKLYSYTNNWEYYSNTNINDYIYNISMKLKN